LEIVSVSSIVGYHLWQAKQAHRLGRFIAEFCLVIAALAVITWAISDTHYLHLHHYCVGLILFPFCRFPTVISLVCQAFFLGMAVEGVARWGLDPVWYVAN